MQQALKKILQLNFMFHPFQSKSGADCSNDITYKKKQNCQELTILAAFGCEINTFERNEC